MRLKDHPRIYGASKCCPSREPVHTELECSEGTVREFDTPEYNALIPPGRRKPGSRSAIVVDVHKVLTVCNSTFCPICPIDAT
jgi:hypothetical protein